MKVKELKEALVSVQDGAEVFIDHPTYSKELDNIEYNMDYNIVYLG